MESKTAEQIIKEIIPNGIINVKSVKGGNGKPQYEAEIKAIAKCMHTFAEQQAVKVLEWLIGEGLLFHGNPLQQKTPEELYKIFHAENKGV